MTILDRLQTGREMSFAKFWRLYLDAHKRPGTRAAHYLGTALGIASTIAAIWCGQVAFLFAGIAIAFVLAVGSHWVIERNQPLIGVSAFYGTLADLRMCWLALTGRLREEYRRLGLLD
jgi:hypothetical protein